MQDRNLANVSQPSLTSKHCRNTAERPLHDTELPKARLLSSTNCPNTAKQTLACHKASKSRPVKLTSKRCRNSSEHPQALHATKLAKACQPAYPQASTKATIAASSDGHTVICCLPIFMEWPLPFAALESIQAQQWLCGRLNARVVVTATSLASPLSPLQAVI